MDRPDVGGNFNYTTTFQAYLFAGVGVFHMNYRRLCLHIPGLIRFTELHILPVIMTRCVN